MNKKRIGIIGGGISGLSAACYAAKNGHDVKVFEKNESLGGRARQFKTDNGYTFDMGPSWYWMPDIIEEFFSDFGYTTSDFYKLVQLDPQFEILFKQNSISFPSNFEEMISLFESFEKGAGKQLQNFMQDAEVKYEIGMKDFVAQPCHSWLEFVKPTIFKSALKLNLLTNYRSFVKRYFSSSYLRSVMEFPVIFLGASPKEIPALYSMMNYGGYKLGTWYPMGGFYKLIEAQEKIAKNLGVSVFLNTEITKIHGNKGELPYLVYDGKREYFDEIITSADYHHSETLLDDDKKNYSATFWKKKTFAPSCLLFYLGFRTKLPNLTHHTLFFESDLDVHIDEIYKTKSWPKDPLFYACCPSKTDSSVAPEGHENVFLLMPIATDIEDSEEIREHYFKRLLQRLENKTGIANLESYIDYKRSYCVSDFESDYNAYGGNAYGLANTLKQTAVFKPKIKNQKIDHLWYTGQLTVPGPGVPPALISGKIVANQIN